MEYKCKKLTDRQSGIELLKIIAIFFILVFHVTRTLGSIITIGKATTDIQMLLLTLIWQLGTLGNDIFFVCSAWFLVDRTDDVREKAVSLVSTVWGISIFILCLYLLICPSCLTMKDIIKQIFPTCFGNNWYMTCYIIFLFIYPWLNRLIAITDQKQLLKITLFSSSLWIIADYIKVDCFFPSRLILWITIYFLIAYLKLYCNRMMSNIKVGYCLVLTGIIGYVAQVIVTNYVGLYFIGALSDKVLYWNGNCCPFYIMIAIGSLIIALQATYKIGFINYISGLTMFIYLFHENYLFRRYTRPAIWQYIYKNYGYTYVVILDFTFAIILFLLSVIVSAIYKETLQRLVMKASHKLYVIVVRIYNRMECLIIKIK